MDKKDSTYLRMIDFIQHSEIAPLLLNGVTRIISIAQYDKIVTPIKLYDKQIKMYRIFVASYFAVMLSNDNET